MALSKENRTTVISISIGLVALVVAAVGVHLVVKTYFNKGVDYGSADFLGRVAAEQNKKLPRKVDDQTELVEVTGTEGLFKYSYRLTQHQAEDVDPAWVKDTLQPNMRDTVCKTPETRDNLLKKGVTLRYSYLDKDRRFIASFDVTPADCGFPAAGG